MKVFTASGKPWHSEQREISNHKNMKFSTLERKARTAVKNTPESRKLDRAKIGVAKLQSKGLSWRNASIVRSLISARRQILILKQMNKILYEKM